MRSAGAAWPGWLGHSDGIRKVYARPIRFAPATSHLLTACAGPRRACRTGGLGGGTIRHQQVSSFLGFSYQDLRYRIQAEVAL
jgi:hypothetical protein